MKLYLALLTLATTIALFCIYSHFDARVKESNEFGNQIFLVRMRAEDKLETRLQAEIDQSLKNGDAVSIRCSNAICKLER